MLLLLSVTNRTQFPSSSASPTLARLALTSLPPSSRHRRCTRESLTVRDMLLRRHQRARLHPHTQTTVSRTHLGLLLLLHLHPSLPTPRRRIHRVLLDGMGITTRPRLIEGVSVVEEGGKGAAPAEEGRPVREMPRSLLRCTTSTRGPTPRRRLLWARWTGPSVRSRRSRDSATRLNSVAMAQPPSTATPTLTAREQAEAMVDAWNAWCKTSDPHANTVAYMRDE